MEDGGAGEAEDETKQESKLEKETTTEVGEKSKEEKETTTEVGKNDIRLPALAPRVPGDLKAHHQMNTSKFTTYDKARNEVLACAGLRASTGFRESRVQKQDAVRDETMNVDRLA